MRDGIAISTSTIPLHAVDRAVLDGDDVGFIKLHVADGTDRILGATIVSRSAGELIGQVTQAMVAGSGVRELAQVIHPYPTESSAIGAAAQAWCREQPARPGSRQPAFRHRLHGHLRTLDCPKRKGKRKAARY